jgi:hypothetical protein
VGELHLENNQLSGPIPPELGSLSVGELHLENNQLSGTIPKELGNLTYLWYLNLVNNQLSCWETPAVLEWAQTVSYHSWDDPPGITICNPVYLPVVARLALEIETERDVLLALYQRTDGKHWTNQSGWLVNEDYCSWYGVTCVDGTVQRLDLANNQLSGPFPPELGMLDNLTTLDLGRNELTGSVPKELGNLRNLTTLRLDNNQLNGPISPELGNLGNLQILNLGVNRLIGFIPPELGNLGNLESLILGANSLDGFIPPELGNLGNLESLILGSNRLNGRIPQELSKLTRLQNLHLRYNQLYCWETSGVLEWAQTVPTAVWDDPPGSMICQYYPGA